MPRQTIASLVEELGHKDRVIQDNLRTIELGRIQMKSVEERLKQIAMENESLLKDKAYFKMIVDKLIATRTPVNALPR